MWHIGLYNHAELTHLPLRSLLFSLKIGHSVLVVLHCGNKVQDALQEPFASHHLYIPPSNFIDENGKPITDDPPDYADDGNTQTGWPIK